MEHDEENGVVILGDHSLISCLLINVCGVST